MHAVIKVLFKCEHCGACCRMTRAINEVDIERVLAYTHEDEPTVRQKLDQVPCGYQVDNLCSIHLVKPDVCRWWPGPGVMSCPGYKKLVDKYCKPGTMSRICNEPELAELYTKCILSNSRDAALELLKRLDIEA